jgi:UrcA family protein
MLGRFQVKNSFLYTATIVALFGAASAQAGGFESPKQVVVHYGDIDMKQASGAQLLLARIDTAASQVCEMSADTRDLAARQVFANCKSGAEDRALASLPFNLVAKADNGVEIVASR